MVKISAEFSVESHLCGTHAWTLSRSGQSPVESEPSTRDPRSSGSCVSAYGPLIGQEDCQVLSKAYFTILLSLSKIMKENLTEMCFGTYKQVVGWGGGQALKVRGTQDLNLVVKKPDISHRFVKHRRRICLHHFNFRVSTCKHHYMPFKYIFQFS